MESLPEEAKSVEGSPAESNAENGTPPGGKLDEFNLMRWLPEEALPEVGTPEISKQK